MKQRFRTCDWGEGMALMTAAEQPIPEPVRGDLLQAFLDLSVPEGFRAELIDGEITVTPPPDGEHETTISALSRQLFRHAKVDVDVLPTKGLIVPNGRFIPDGTVTPSGLFRGAEPWALPKGVLLVFEVTSTRPDKDRTDKRLGYAGAEIPCYLLIDRSAGRLTLFTEPHRGDYSTSTKAGFGDPLPLPEPLGLVLDTTPFA